MNFRQIEMLRAVMATGSFTAAAKLLHISQPGISRAVRHLETRLGVPLFQRMHGRVQPTEEAKALHREIERSYRGVESIQAFAESLKTGINSTLRVVASANVGLQIVPQAMSELSAGGKEALLTLEILRGPLMVEALLREQADIGISAVPLDHPLLESRAVGQWKLVCVFPVGHPLQNKTKFTALDALAYPLVSFSNDTPQGQIVSRLLQNQRPARSMEVRSGHTACVLAAAGAGVAFADDLTARFFEAHGLAWRHMPDSQALTAYAVWNANVPLSRLANRLGDAVQSRFRSLAKKTPSARSRATA